MPLTPGSRLGGYEIVAPLGAGGMGEVYRARDGKLQREVALKVLPEAVARDADRRARFEREAQVLAALNHPHIAAIYGVAESQDVTALVLELVEGPTLADRLGRGPIPLDEALPIARQIAEALEAAHEAGIVHRDLKPANIKVRADGTVKVLDFGLAKAVNASARGSAADPANSPTLTVHATEVGLILGTAAYMAPEQARGRAVDKRADIWALGVILWEMLTGRQLFVGETISDTLAAVLTTTPDLDALPAATPPSVRRVVDRCLQRDPTHRIRDAGDVRLELDVSEAQAVTRDTPEGSPRRAWLGWAAAAALAVTLAIVWTGAESAADAPPSGRPLQFTVELSPDRALATRLGSNVLFTPDGRTLVFAAAGPAGGDAFRQLMVNRLDGAPPTAIPGVEIAFSPFVSPDGRWIGYFTSDTLLKVGLQGGAAIPIARGVNIDSRGATWGKDGTIVYAPTIVGGLWRVPASGGDPAPLTRLNDALDERSHRWPSFLPCGCAVLFMTQRLGEDYDDADIEAVSLSDGRRTVLVRGGAYPRYAPGGRLLFVRQHTLYSVPFDADRLEVGKAPPTPVVEGILASTGDQESGDGSAEYDVSATGSLVFRAATATPAAAGTEFVWVDARGGGVTPAFKEAFRASSLEISPDGQTVAIDGRSETRMGIWLRDLERGTVAPLSSPRGGESQSAWSADGKWLAFGIRGERGSRAIAIRSMTGREPERVVELAAAPTSWSADGRTLYADVRGSGTLADIHAIDVTGASASQPVVRSNEVDAAAKLSPDGQWLLYFSNRSGTQQVYVQPAGSDRPVWQVSTDRGSQPRWSRDGRTIYYVRTAPPNVPGAAAEGGRILAVDVTRSGEGLRFGAPRTIHEGSSLLGAPERPVYDVHPDGRLLLIRREALAAPKDGSHVVVALDWAASLARSTGQ
jgi:serine/threonine-protein kinase